MTVFSAEQLIAAGHIGSTYALLAVGYAVAYSTMNFVNFSHGEVFMLGALTGYLVLDAWTDAAGLVLAPRAAFATALLAGAAVGAASAWIIQRFLYQPLLHRGRLSLILVALATSLFLQQSVLLFLRTHASGSSERRFPVDDANVFLGLSLAEGGSLVLLLGCGAFVVWFVRSTDTGIQMRVISYGMETLHRMKVPLPPLLSRAFVLGGLLAGAAGVTYGAQYTLTPYVGFVPGIKAFLGCIIGGRTIPGALLGGFLLGATEGLVTGVTGTGQREIIVGCVVAAFLAVRPHGILRGGQRRTI